MAGHDRRVHRRFEDRDTVLAGALGGVHRDVGVPQQLCRVRRPGPSDRDTDAAADDDLLPLDREWRPQHVDDAVRDRHGVAQLRSVVEQDGEFVTAEPGGDVRGSEDLAEAFRDTDQQPVAGCVTHGVVDDLEVVEVQEEDDRKPVDRGLIEAGVDPIEEEGPVGEARQGVVIRLEPELFLEPRELGQRLLEVAILEGHRGLVRERLEEAQIVIRERRAGRESIGDPQRADQVRFAAKRAHHVTPVVVGAQAGRHEERRRRIADSLMDRVGTWVGRGHHDLGGAVVARRRPQRLHLAAARVQDHLGDFGTEHRPRVTEQRDQGRIELGRVLQDPRGLVEQLEPLVLLTLRDVGLVGEEDDHERKDQEPEKGRVDPQDRHREQGEARVRERHHAPELDHLGQLLELRRAAGDRDRRSRS